MESLYDILPFDSAEQIAECAYVSRSGKRKCTHLPVEGEQFCVLHGANIERSKEQIQRRLLACQEKAVATLEDIIRDGYDDKTRLTASLAVLDRTGLGPKSTVALETVEEDLTQLSEDQLAQRAERLSNRFRELRTQRMNVEIMDHSNSSHHVQ